MNKKSKILLIIILVVLFLGVSGLIIWDKFFDKKSTTSNSNNNTTTIHSSEGTITLKDSYKITKGGKYTFTGELKDGSITIDTDEDVTITLSGVSITNSNGPAINVISAKNVYLVIDGDNTLSATVNENEEDACIYSKDDLEISGTGTLTVKSNLDGITSKDDLVIKSGTYIINTDDDAIKGKDSVTIEDGKFTINAKGDGIKATNDEDIKKNIITINGGEFNITTETDGFDSSNIITINKGTLTINSGDDGIHADGLLEINNGTMNINAVEGLEATYIKINDGTINISASDDGINAANKSDNYEIAIEINGGNITIKMGQGDTDGIDSNGNIYVNGGTINITGNSTFDYDGEAKYTGGTIIENGVETNTITNQFMGGTGGQGGPQGDFKRR